jgi:hypothetical protein
MRRILAGDVAAAARALHAVPAAARAARLAELIARAEVADGHRAATGRAHPLWGGGSLMAAARAEACGPEPDFDDECYCVCWVMVLEGLLAHRAGLRGQPEAQEMQSGAVGSSASRFSGISSPQSRHSP